MLRCRPRSGNYASSQLRARKKLQTAPEVETLRRPIREATLRSKHSILNPRGEGAYGSRGDPRKMNTRTHGSTTPCGVDHPPPRRRGPVHNNRYPSPICCNTTKLRAKVRQNSLPLHTLPVAIHRARQAPTADSFSASPSPAPSLMPSDASTMHQGPRRTRVDDAAAPGTDGTWAHRFSNRH
jgi:hypothetical protein